jgi:5-methylcytosine-specific restriction endonuclease McrA
MSRDVVWVVVDADGRPIRILKSFRAVVYLSGHGVYSHTCEMPRKDAVAAIRHQIFLRSQGNCEACGCPVNESTAHMHEKQHRGRGGEISLENSLFICAACHKWAHRARNPQWRQL